MSDFEQLGPYKIEGKLGQGGMGAVYRGENIQSGQQAAIKVIASTVADQERFRRRFAAEIETLKKLDHKNIVSLIGYGEEQGHLFFSMQLVEGLSLQQRIKKEKRLSWSDTIQYGIDICSALKHAHDLGVIHRDLKPANLLIGPDNEMLLTDFGIAKLWRGNDMTAVGAMLGTADYMAPEQAGDGPITQRTDLYALGNVLYAALVGRPPFAGKQLTKVITSLHTEPPPPIDLILPDLPTELAVLIHQLLAKDPEDRPPTALSVGNRLRAMQAGLSRRDITHIDDGNKTVSNAAPKNTPREASFELGPESNLPTDERLTMDATLDSLAVTGAQENGLETVDSVVQEFRESPVTAAQTHFRTVDQEERRKATSTTTSDDGPNENSYENLLSTLALVLLLIGMIAAAFYMLQRPSADSLYGRIREARESGDLSNGSGEIKQFLEEYANDPRYAEVEDLADQLDSERIYRRLRARARFKGGVNRLAPAEQSFVEAMALRDQNAKAARSQMEAWQKVFSSDTDDSSIQKMASVISLELQRLSKPDIESDDQVKKLRDWIDKSVEGKQGRARTEFLEAVIELFGEKPWADDEITRAREMLQQDLSRQN